MKLYSSAIALGFGVLMITLAACNNSGGSSTPATNCTIPGTNTGGNLVNGICQPVGTSASGTIACTTVTGQAGVQTVAGCGVLVSSGLGSCAAMVPGAGMYPCIQNGYYGGGYGGGYYGGGYYGGGYPIYQSPIYYYSQPYYGYRFYNGRRR